MYIYIYICIYLHVYRRIYIYLHITVHHIPVFRSTPVCLSGNCDSSCYGVYGQGT